MSTTRPVQDGDVERVDVEDEAPLERSYRLCTSTFRGHSCVEDRARGRGVAQALLHVDTANTTGATRLYERVGMRAVVVIDVWRRTVPT